MNAGLIGPEELCDPEIWETVCGLDMKMAARIIELVQLRGKTALQASAGHSVPICVSSCAP